MRVAMHADYLINHCACSPHSTFQILFELIHTCMSAIKKSLWDKTYSSEFYEFSEICVLDMIL